MFAEFNYDEFPIVNVKFKKINTNDDYKAFINKWLLLYQNKKNFSFVFDTTEMGLVNPKYAIKIASFIKDLKKLPIQYLQQSLIIINNKSTELLLKLIFSIQKPISKVYLIRNKDEVKDVYNKSINNELVNCPYYLPEKK
jgi:hypothetical protein